MQSLVPQPLELALVGGREKGGREKGGRDLGGGKRGRDGGGRGWICYFGG